MNDRTITAANAILLISVAKLFPVPQRIQGFSADDMASVDATDNAETSMGVDGRLSAGWVPVPVRQTIVLQADSLSNDLFEQWAEYERNAREKLIATGTQMVLATNRQYAMSRGFLRSIPLVPSLGKTLKPRSYVLEWESVTPAPKF